MSSGRLDASLRKRAHLDIGTSSPLSPALAAPGPTDDELSALLDSIDAAEDAKRIQEEDQMLVDLSAFAADCGSALPQESIPPIIYGMNLDADALLSRLGAIGDPDRFFSVDTPATFDRAPVFIRAVVAGVTSQHSSSLASGKAVQQTALIAWHLEPSLDGERVDARARLAPCVIILRGPWAQGADEIYPGDIVHVVSVRNGRVTVDNGGHPRQQGCDRRWSAFFDDETLFSSNKISRFLPTWLPPSPLGAIEATGPRSVFVALIDERRHALVVHPDFLISPTLIADSVTCLRRAVLKETMGEAGGSDDGSQVKLVGTLKHQLFESALKMSTEVRPDAAAPLTTPELKAALKEAAAAIIRSPKSMIELYSISQSEKGGSLDLDEKVRKEMEGVIDGIVDWMDLFVATRVLDHSPPFRVLKVVSVEEVILSPIWGIKGICDANVDIELHAPPGRGDATAARLRHRLRLPLELKTGKRPRGGGAFEEHRAQMLIYSLIISERYGSAISSYAQGPLSAPPRRALSLDINPGKRPRGGYNCDIAADFDGEKPIGGIMVYLSSAAEVAQRLELDAAAHNPAQVGVRAGAANKPDDVAHHYSTSVAPAWSLQSALLINRNILAVGLVRAQQAASADSDESVSDPSSAHAVLPAVLFDERLCGRCYMFSACASAHACQESPASVGKDLPGSSEVPSNIEDISNRAATLFSSFVSGLRPNVAAYFRKWIKLCDIEAFAQSKESLGPKRVTDSGSGPLDISATTGRTMLWRKQSAERESEGTCARGLLLRNQRQYLVASDFDAERSKDKSIYGAAYEYEYTFETTEAVSLLTLNISEGDYVIASGCFRGPYGLISGTVALISANRIVLHGNRDVATAFPQALTPPSGSAVGPLGSPDFLWRVDRDDYNRSSIFNRSIKDSLVRLVGGRTIFWADDGDGVPWSSPLVADEGNESLAFPGGAGCGDLKRQALVIDLVAPRMLPEACFPWDLSHSAAVGLSTAPSAFPRAPPSSDVVRNLEREYHEVLNDDQRAAVGAALRLRDYACVLGMPGTGKTATLAFIIRCLTALGRSVLVTSHTHNAVDNVLLKCIDAKIDVLRIVGRTTTVGRKDLAPYCLETLVASGKFPSLHHLHAHLQHSQVVGVTCLGIKHSLFARRTFDVCIIDEASQIPEPLALGPMRVARATILVGDHMQLPPLVISKSARLGGMGTSLFKRLSEAHPAAVFKLTRQYRMNEDIQTLSNLLMYDGALKCGSEAVARGQYQLSRNDDVMGELPWLAHVLQPSNAVTFLDTDSTASARAAASEMGSGASLEQRGTKLVGGGGGMTNPVEAAAVSVFASELLLRGGLASDIGIIAPFHSQLRLIRRMLTIISSNAGGAGDQLAAIEVDTVDRFQGRDKRVIIMSMVRSNASGEVGQILADVRRLNVAVSRAKEKLVLVGSASCLALGSPELASMIAHIRSRGWLVPLPWGSSKYLDLAISLQ
jgi:hypothetical protein